MSEKQQQSYHQKYYKKNKQKFYNYNHNRPSKKNIYFGIEIDGITYLFEKKSIIPIKKIYKKDIQDNQNKFKLIKTT